LNFQSHRELFDYVRKYNLDNLKSLNEYFSKYNFSFLDINDLLPKLFSSDILLIDARSENEFEETAICDSKNFPILKNGERHFVGLVYKKYSPLAAGELAKEFAIPKTDSLKNFLIENNAKEKEIIVHCWRGGGRSKYTASMIIDLGYQCKVLTKGIKSYRNSARDFLNQKFPYELIELNGLTGCGKTEILNALSNQIPVIDLEKAARHFSSLFGFIPYQIRNYKPVKNQSAFENNIFSQIVYNQNKFSQYNTYLIESESKKVGDFFIPQNLFSKLQISKSIQIISSMENRVKRLNKDYFEEGKNGFKEMLEIFMKKENFFRREMSSKYYESALTELKNNNSEKFIEILLEKYYDMKYFDKRKSPVAILSSDDIDKCVEEVFSIWYSV